MEQGTDMGMDGIDYDMAMWGVALITLGCGFNNSTLN